MSLCVSLSSGRQFVAACNLLMNARLTLLLQCPCTVSFEPGSQSIGQGTRAPILRKCQQARRTPSARSWLSSSLLLSSNPGKKGSGLRLTHLWQAPVDKPRFPPSSDAVPSHCRLCPAVIWPAVSAICLFNPLNTTSSLNTSFCAQQQQLWAAACRRQPGANTPLVLTSCCGATPAPAAAVVAADSSSATCLRQSPTSRCTQMLCCGVLCPAEGLHAHGHTVR
jgi:hypothetical protein